jgi:hypothetical protein
MADDEDGDDDEDDWAARLCLSLRPFSVTSVSSVVNMASPRRG